MMFESPVKYARISLTSRCPLNCGYCRPFNKDCSEKEIEELSYSQLERLIRILNGLGVDKFRFTGGEPFARPGIFDFLKNLNLSEYYITTSLHISKDRIKEINGLTGAGLSGINVSLDTLDKNKYRKLTGGDLNLVKENLKDLDIDNLKLNTILIKGFNIDETKDIIEYARSIEAVPRFIEKMNLIYDNLKRGSLKKLKEKLIQKEIIQERYFRKKNSVSVYHKLKTGPGEVGFITPFSSPFCSRCDKIRITSKGKLKLCLFEDGGLNLKKIINKTDTEIKENIKLLLTGKKGERISNNETVNMVQIGG